MRPYLLMIAVVLMAAAAFGQQPYPYDALCFYGCVPRLTTPEISLGQASPNPVGATNATTGLIAGATNSTLSQIQGSTSSVYTLPVWYQGGGAPLLSEEVDLSPEPLSSDRRMYEEMREDMREENHEMRVREERLRDSRHASADEKAAKSEQRPLVWTYINGPAAEGSGVKKAERTLTNEDVARQNEKNGVVKYEGKTEKI
jgi:hypothetical protein